MGFFKSFIRANGERCKISDASDTKDEYVILFPDRYGMFIKGEGVPTFRGSVPYQSMLSSGAYVTIADDSYLVLCAAADMKFSSVNFTACKTNVEIDILKPQKTVANEELKLAFVPAKADVLAHAIAHDGGLDEEEFGRVDTFWFTIFIPAYIPISVMDRIVFGDYALCAVSVDPFTTPGINRVLCERDTR